MTLWVVTEDIGNPFALQTSASRITTLFRTIKPNLASCNKRERIFWGSIQEGGREPAPPALPPRVRAREGEGGCACRASISLLGCRLAVFVVGESEAERISHLHAGGNGPNANTSPQRVLDQNILAQQLDYRMAVQIISAKTQSRSIAASA